MQRVINKLKTMPIGVKASIAFLMASIITKGIAYITTPIYTRLLTPDEFGQTTIFLTWQAIFGIIAMFNLQAGVFNNGMVEYPEKRSDYSYSMLILSNIISLSFSLILVVSYPLIKEYIKIELPFVILMCIMFFFQPAYNFWLSRQRYELKYKWTTFWTVVTSFLSPGVAILFLLFSDYDKLYARIFGAEVTLIIIYIGFYIYLGKKNGWKLNTVYWKEALLFNLPLLPHYLSTYMLANSDKIMISNLVSDSATAFYSVAYSVASVVLIVWTSVNSSLIPYTYENCKVKNYKKISDITIPIMFVFAIVSVLIIMLAPEVIWIMSTKEYMEAIYAIPPIVGGVFFQAQYYIYANIIYYYKKPKYVMLASISATVINIVLNYIFINKYGYLAAGYTTLLCYMIQAIIDYCSMKKVVGTSVYNMKSIIGMSVFIILIALVSNIIYDNTILRYVLVTILMLILILARKRIMSILKIRKQ